MSTNIDAKGPFLFDVPELQPGASWNADLRNREEHGRKGYYKPFLPFDYAQVTNQSVDNNIRVVYNGGIYEDLVVASSVETYDEMGVTNVQVFNAGTTAIDAGNAVVALGVDAYGADDAAREQKESGPVSQVVEHLTGLSLNGV